MQGSPTDLIQFGILGLITLLMLSGWLWPKPAVDSEKRHHAEELAREQERTKQAEHQRDELLKLYQDQVIPVLTQLNSTTVPLLAQLSQDVHDIQVAQNATATNPPSAKRPRA